MAQRPDQSQALVHRPGARHLLRALALLAASALAHAALAAGPDTSARSFIKLEHFLNRSDPFYGWYKIYAPPTATATSTWALVGNSNLSGDVIFLGACCTQYNYITNPVTVTGPFDGNPHPTQNLLPPPLANPDSVERFGAALAIQGNRIAVGSTVVLTEVLFPGPPYSSWIATAGGRVHLYQHDGSSFVHERTIAYGATAERFGQAVDLRPDRLLVGRPGASPGAADLFDPDSGALIATFTSPASGDKFGETVALLDDLALVGASGSGAVYVYRHDGMGNWAAAGTLASPGAASEFGAAIDVDNGRILVGAPGIDRAYVYEDDGDANWPVVAEISGQAGSRLGQSVALTGDAAFIGAPEVLFGASTRVGLVVRHERASDGTWPYVSLKASRRPTNGDNFGYLVSASSTLLSAAQSSDSTRPGEFYIFSPQAGIPDVDVDTVSDYGDNCSDLYNPGQADFEGDDIGDDCDPDGDNDGLLNTEEDTLGTDPYDADTDNDGLVDGEDPNPIAADGDSDGRNDPVDNCPLVNNPGQGNVDGDAFGDACDTDIDGDALSNDTETTLGTDPYNSDTDGDLHRDGDDFLPLDNKDGWAGKYRFQAGARQMALGSQVLLVQEWNTNVLRSFAKSGGVWSEVPAPVIPGNPAVSLYGGGAAGNRFVALVGTSFHQLDWSPAGGWVRHGPVTVSGDVQSLVGAAVSSDTVVLEANPFYGIGKLRVIYDLTATGPVFRAIPPELAGGSSLQDDGLAGNYLFTIQSGAMIAYNLADAYSSQSVTWPDPTETNSTKDFFPVGVNKVFVDGSRNSYWLSLANGVWSLEVSGIAKSSYIGSQDKHISGGDGTVVLHELDPATQGGLELYRVRRVSNGSEVGKINEWGDGLEVFQTNGAVIVQQYRGYGVDLIDIYEVPPAAPPGC